MKWTKTQPKVSGHYWTKLPDAYPTIVKVYVRKDDPDYPDTEVWYFGNDIMGDFLPHALYAGPIKPPKG
jgi:hypothetical protein